MRQDDTGTPGAPALFRRQATLRRQAFGSVTVVVSPSGRVALAVAIIATVVIGSVAWFVEIPQTAKAVGVLMPPGGMLNVIARAQGRVAAVHVHDGQAVVPGDALVDVVADEINVHLTRLLHAERLLLDQSRDTALDVDRHRLNALDEHRDWLTKRLAVTQDEYDLQSKQARLFERRLKRRRGLAAEGLVAADQVDHEEAQWLAARTRLATMRRSIIDIEQRLSALQFERQQFDDDAAQRIAQHDIERNRFESKLSEHTHRMERTIRANESAVVARVDAKAGMPVNPGDILVRLFRPFRTLEAWLYLPSARSGFLKQGQQVKLRFDAYPHQVFGTTDATVASVSRVPIAPWDLRIPLQLSEPMFEIRATIERTSIQALDTTWPLKPGVSFKADIIQRRYKLYQWLLRRLTRNGKGA